MWQIYMVVYTYIHNQTDEGEKAMDIIRRNMTPRYFKIYEELHRALAEGKYSEGDRFPSEHELCQRYRVSRGTVREAMKLLFQQGLVTREQGRGSFVTLKHKIEQDAHELMGFTELMGRHGKKASAKLLEVRTEIPPKRIRNILGLDPSAKTVKVRRLRFGDDEPLIIERSYFVHALFEPLLKYDLEQESIYEALYRETNLSLGTAQHAIEAVPADPSDSRLLNINTGSPLLLIKRLIKTEAGDSFQYAEDLYRSDKLNFTIQTMPYDERRKDFTGPIGLTAKNESLPA